MVAVETADGTAKIRQETETGYNEVEASMPCVVTIQKPNYDPRYPTIKSKMAARKKPIGELEVGEIPESSMEVVKVYAPAKRQAGVKIKAESPVTAKQEFVVPRSIPITLLLIIFSFVNLTF